MSKKEFQKQDVLQNMILFNDVPNSFLEDFSSEIETNVRIVPVSCRAKVLKQIRLAIDGSDKILRFYVMLTALTHSPKIRSRFLSGCNDAQMCEWLTKILPKAWEHFLMGTNNAGVPKCTHMRDAKYSGALDFVSKLQTDYMTMGWKEPKPLQ